MARNPTIFVPAGLAAVVGGGFVVYLALILRTLDCSMEYDSECTASGLAQLVLAGLGLLPALATLVLAIAGRGDPLRWLGLTALVYAAWVVFVFGWSG